MREEARTTTNSNQYGLPGSNQEALHAGTILVKPARCPITTFPEVSRVWECALKNAKAETVAMEVAHWLSDGEGWLEIPS